MFEVAFDPDGSTLAVDSQAEQLELRDLAWLAQLREDLDRPLREACARTGGALAREVWDSDQFDATYPTICPT